MGPSTGRAPRFSLLAIGCATAFWSVFYFLTTAAGLQFNEDVFGRLYTLGTLLMMGVYGALFLGLMVGGAGSTFLAFKHDERPRWFPKVALVANLLAPAAWFIFLT